MRILIAADTFAPDVNGSASFSRQLAVGLAGRGHEVHIVAPAADRWHGTRQEEHGGVEFTVHRLYSWRWIFHPWLRFALPWRIRANADRIMNAIHPDVVHFQSHIVVGRGMAPAAKARAIRLVGTNHTMPENIVQHVQILPSFMIRWVVRLQWRAAGRVFGLADVVTSPTRRSADYLENNTGLRGTLAVSNGIFLDRYTADLSPRDRNRIVFLGRLDEEKHIDDLVRAVALLDPALDVRVDVMGEGDQRPKLAVLIAQLGLQDRVRLAGKVGYDELRATLTAASVFAMPSRAELQSITTMEAMASGLPVVAADAMALPHLVRDGVNGWLFAPGDIEGFAARLTEVLTMSAADRERMQRASLEIVAEHDIERTLDTFEAIYAGEQVAAV